MRLSGRAAIVTGAASGIGAATAKALAAEGAQVLAVDRVPVEKSANPDSAGHGRIETLVQSVSEADAAGRIVGAAISAFGRLDILVNNAGIGRNAPAESMSDADWDEVLAVNLTAQFKLARAAIPHLKASPAGRIINVASVMAEATDYGLSAYCASKAGVAGLTRTLALELGKFAITANYILPGAIMTGMTRAGFSNPEIAEVWAKKSPLRRLGQPEDIARGILFLAGDEAGFVTGHGLNIDGGLLLRT